MRMKRRSSRTDWSRQVVWLAASGMLLLAPAGWLSAALAVGTTTAAQPVTLPHKDILDADAAIKNGAAAETSQEIHRPAEAAGGADKKSSAAGSANGDDTRVIGRQNAAKSFWQIGDFMPLAIVLALVLGAAWAVKRYLPARRLVMGSGVLEVVARLPLSPKQSLVLVKMGQRMVLVGVTPERVNSVCLVDDPEQVAELTGRIASQARDSSAHEFGQSLDEQADTFDSGEDGGGLEMHPSPAAGGVRGLLEKVRRLSRSQVT
jgi:flagellar biosynthetic protein FliO